LITPLTVTRAGGIAGAQQSLSVSADGSWVYTDAKTGQTTSGQLTAAQASALTTLLTDPKLTQLLSDHATPTSACTDTFTYTLQFGTSDTFTFTDCGNLAPSVQAVIQALSDDTAF
jgi:hypothetical protein